MSKPHDSSPGETHPRVLIWTIKKRGIEKFGELAKRGWKILSTGSSGKYLEREGIPYTEIHNVMHDPAMRSTRIQIHHDNVFENILSDIVVINLRMLDEGFRMEEIDTDGHALIRTAVLHCQSCITTMVDPEDYQEIIDEVVEYGRVSEATRLACALKAIRYTSDYDSVISYFLSKRMHDLLDPAPKTPAA